MSHFDKIDEGHKKILCISKLQTKSTTSCLFTTSFWFCLKVYGKSVLEKSAQNVCKKKCTGMWFYC